MEKEKKIKLNSISILQIISVIALLAAMQFAVDTGRVLPIFLASPTSIVREGVKIMTNGTLWPHLLLTLQEAYLGYGLAAVTGIAIGLLWVLFPKLESFMNVFCSAIMAVPKVAILPLLILWFGIGFESKVFLIYLSSLFTILYNTVTGAKQCRQEYLKVAKVFQASRVQTVFGVIIPAATPSIFNGLKLSAATAVTMVLFAEMNAAKAGLGYLLVTAQNLLNTPQTFFLIVLVTLLAVINVKLVGLVEYAVCHKWRRV